MGTTPKLVGKTPGIGYPTFDHTLRRTTVATNHPICRVLDEAGLPFELSNSDPSGTRIYEYPIFQGPVPPASEISLWEQAVNLATVQREWADNSVSNTLYFKPKWVLLKHIRNEDSFSEQVKLLESIVAGEWKLLIQDRIDFEHYKVKIEFTENYWTKKLQMKIYRFDPNHEEDILEKVLAAFAPLIKSCSLLPHTANGVYEQMPEEGISESDYKRRLAEMKPINWANFTGSDGMDQKYCDGPECEIPK